MVLICAFVVFNITCEGNIGWITTLTVLTGLCGMCFGKDVVHKNNRYPDSLKKLSCNMNFLGFVIACACDNERSATYMAMGSFLPIVMLCGIIWPIEGMHAVLKWISFVLPLTKSTESMRAMLARGWSISNPTVYNGFISTFIWICIFMTLSLLLLKFKKG